jgi:hypothetical protein
VCDTSLKDRAGRVGWVERWQCCYLSTFCFVGSPYSLMDDRGEGIATIAGVVRASRTQRVDLNGGSSNPSLRPGVAICVAVPHVTGQHGATRASTFLRQDRTGRLEPGGGDSSGTVNPLVVGSSPTRGASRPNARRPSLIASGWPLGRTTSPMRGHG